MAWRFVARHRVRKHFVVAGCAFGAAIAAALLPARRLRRLDRGDGGPVRRLRPTGAILNDTNVIGRWRLRFRRFTPRLAGWTPRDRSLASVGAMLAICAAGFLSWWVAAPSGPRLPLIVAPMGASAVLLFAVPASPLAQPWSVIVGNMLSALIGIAVGRYVADPFLATGLAVGLAIGAMTLTRSLHPPGGAAALLTVLASHHPQSLPYQFALQPVGLNSCLMVACAWLFHRFSGHVYPHRPAVSIAAHATSDPAPDLRSGLQDEDIDAALAQLHETFDIDRDDLKRLVQEVQLHALARRRGSLSCADIMSRDVISTEQYATCADAREIMHERGLRILPVVNRVGILVGMAELVDLTEDEALVASVMKKAVTAWPDSPALELIARLSDGRAHGAAIIDPDRHVVGLITQTDLLAATMNLAAN